METETRHNTCADCKADPVLRAAHLTLLRARATRERMAARRERVAK